MPHLQLSPKPLLLLPLLFFLSFSVEIVNNRVPSLVDKSEYVTYELQGNTTSVHEANPNLPKNVHLSPNPFNPETTILYDLREATDVQLLIYNLLGQEVRALVLGAKPPEAHTAVWDGRDKQGAQ